MAKLIGFLLSQFRLFDVCYSFVVFVFRFAMLLLCDSCVAFVIRLMPCDSFYGLLRSLLCDSFVDLRFVCCLVCCFAIRLMLCVPFTVLRFVQGFAIRILFYVSFVAVGSVCCFAFGFLHFHFKTIVFTFHFL